MNSTHKENTMETTSAAIPPNGGAVQGNGSSGLNKVHSAIDEAASRARPAIDRAATLAHEAADKVGTVSAQTADWMSAQGEHLSAAQKKLIEDTCSYVSANPFKSLAMAVAAGYVISRIIK
jgi:ElaB protein